MLYSIRGGKEGGGGKEARGTQAQPNLEANLANDATHYKQSRDPRSEVEALTLLSWY